jgi:hypothetical protein
MKQRTQSLLLYRLVTQHCSLNAITQLAEFCARNAKSHRQAKKNKNTNSVASVHEQSILTERLAVGAYGNLRRRGLHIFKAYILFANSSFESQQGFMLVRYGFSLSLHSSVRILPRTRGLPSPSTSLLNHLSLLLPVPLDAT